MENLNDSGEFKNENFIVQGLEENDKVKFCNKKMTIGITLGSFIAIIVVTIILIINLDRTKESISSNENKKETFISSEEQKEEKESEYEYVPIVSTNDLHGFFFPRINEINNENYSLSFKSGGFEYLAKYITLLRKTYGPEGVLYFDAGDQYQGGVESQITNGQIIFDFFNIIKPNASTIGNHGYDYDIDFLKDKINNSSFPYIACNIKDKITNSSTPFGKNQFTSKVFNVKTLKGTKLKIGVIGLTYDMTNSAIIGKGYDNITFLGYKESLLKEINKIKSENELNSIILISHIGLECGLNNTLSNYTKENGKGNCKKTELYDLLQELEPGTVDGIISGHNHFVVHHWIKDIPVMSGINNGANINIMYLPFNKSNNYSLIKDEIIIEGPLPICEKVFEKTKNCSHLENYENLGKLEPFIFHGNIIDSDESMKPLYNKYYGEYKDYNEIEICKLKGLTKPMGKEKTGDSPLGNFITDFIKNVTNSDIAVTTAGDFRTFWSNGKLTKADVKSMFPFPNYLCTIELTGKNLKTIIENVQQGQSGYYPTSGLKQSVFIKPDGTKNITDIRFYEDDYNITEINDTTIYKIASTDYILKYHGDDFYLVEDLLPKENVTCDTSEYIAEKLITYLKLKKVIDLSFIVDPNRPRLTEIQNETCIIYNI